MNYFVKTVLGGSYGDEGKGKVISMLCSEIQKKGHLFLSKECGKEIYGYVIRSNGGPNGGHALVAQNGVKVTGHVLPSGIVREGFLNIIGAGCAIYPKGLIDEITNFKENGLFKSYLKIDSKCAIIITAYRKLNSFQGKFTTGSGIPQAYGNFFNREGITAGDIVLFDERNVQLKIKKLSALLISEFKTYLELNDIEDYDERLQDFLEVASVEAITKELKDAYELFKEYVSFGITTELQEAISYKRPLLNETSQSYFLSRMQNDETGTSSIIDPAWLFVSQSLPIVPQEIHIITKLLNSRVGNGAFIGEFGNRDLALSKNRVLEKYNTSKDEISNLIEKLAKFDINTQEFADALRLEYNEYGETTMRPRGKSPLDVVYLRAISNHFGNSINSVYLWINQCDGIEKFFDKLPIIVGHKDENGNSNDTFNSNEPDSKLRKKTPIIEYVSIWRDSDLIEQGSVQGNLKESLLRIEELSNLTIGGVGIGRKDTDMMHLHYKK